MQPQSSPPIVVGVAAEALFALRGLEPAEGARPPRRGGDEEGLAPGPALPLVELLLASGRGGSRGADLVLLSRQHADEGLRVLEALRRRELAIGRTVFTAGAGSARYLRAFEAELFLTSDEEQAREAAQAGAAGVLVLSHAPEAQEPPGQIRVALDVDAAGPAAVDQPPEHDGGRLPQLAGVLGRLRGAAEASGATVRTALVTSHGASGLEQALRGLGRCGLQTDEAFSLAGSPPEAVLRSFGAQLLLAARHLPVLPDPKPEALAATSRRESRADAGDSPGLDSPFSRLRFRG